MFNLSDELLDRNLNNLKYMDIDTISPIVDYMIFYINQNIKIKVITK